MILKECLMKRINWDNIRLVVILVMVIFLYSFASQRNESRKMTAADIEFADNEEFITLDKVNKLLIQNFNSITSITKDRLDLNIVEKRLESNPMIDDAEVFATVNGRLKAVIRQKIPVARVYEGSRSYYIDYKGEEMPLSENSTARVPLITGSLESVDKNKLYSLVKYIYDDPFLKKNIIGIEVKPSGSLRMRSRNYNYDIVFGRLINAEKKFSNYKAFFQNAVRDTLIEHYKTINLKFTQQVVCTKN